MQPMDSAVLVASPGAAASSTFVLRLRLLRTEKSYQFFFSFQLLESFLFLFVASRK
jgi:hypothetical protein